MTDEAAWRIEVNDVMRHDVRTRIGIGKGYVSMLLTHHEVMTPAQRQAALEGIAEAFGRMETFSRRVLLDEKLESRPVEPQRGDIDVSTVVDAVCQDHPYLVVDVAPDAPRVAYLDPVLVRDVLDNLAANARAAAPAGTDVRLRVGGDAETLRFEVHDDGDGLSEADLPVLFRRYGRTERSRLLREPGMGLGLSIVRRLVEAHDGRYGVDLGDGVTFWVELPVSPNAVRSPERS